MTRGSKGCRTERKERARQRLRSRRYGRRGGGGVEKNERWKKSRC